MQNLQGSEGSESLSDENRIKLMKEIRKQMKISAETLDFETAARLRDRLFELEDGM